MLDILKSIWCLMYVTWTVSLLEACKNPMNRSRCHSGVAATNRLLSADRLIAPIAPINKKTCTVYN